jgi:hypothetical protein
MRNLILSLIDKNSTQLNNAVAEVNVQLAKSNLYRNDNYILICTAVFIVKIEQGAEKKSGECHPILSQVAKCILSPFTYVLSAIEQLGYMQAQLLESPCTVSAGKYFGRFIRSLKEAFPEIGKLQIYKNLDIISKNLAEEKKRKGFEGSDVKSCDRKIDLYSKILELIHSI